MSRRTLKERLDALAGEMIDRGIRLDEAIEELEGAFLRRALEEFDGNQTRAAERLRMHRNTLRRKLQRHGIL